MRRANFIVGFNNWGKTTIIYDLFGQRRFYYHLTYRLTGINAEFVVQSQSNDDIGQDIINRLAIRLNKTKKKQPDIFATLCPSMEPYNDFRQILNDQVFANFNQINLFLIKYKWEKHAELITKNIQKSLQGQGLQRVNCIVIDADTTPDKVRQIMTELSNIY